MKKYNRIISILSLFSILIFFSCKSKEESKNTDATNNQTTQTLVAGAFVTTSPARAQSPFKVLSYGPKGETQGQVQIKIDFSNPIIPLTTLSDAEREEILDHFVLEPEVGGSFRLLGTAAVVFEPEHSLPMATDYLVTVKRGLKDIYGNKLQEDLTWQFKTPLPRISISPGGGDHIDVKTRIQINSTVALDIQSLQSKIVFVDSQSSQAVVYHFSENPRNPKTGQDIGMYRVNYSYFLKPAALLKKDTQYSVRIMAGVMPRPGNRPSNREIYSTFRTFPPFRFISHGFCEHCGSKLTTRPYLAFTNSIDTRIWKDYLTINPAVDEWPFHRGRCEKYSLEVNQNLLEPYTTYTVHLASGLLDIYGQEIENPGSVAFTTGGLTPKMWGPRGYQVVTPNIEPKLGIKTVNIDRVFYKIQPLRPSDILVREYLNSRYSVNDLISRLKSESKRMDIQLNEFSVGKGFFDLRPHLRGQKYGAVVYSFTSPDLACFEDPITYNGLILRTNLGIYSQFHPTGGLIKLNQLTDGLPVAGATIRIYREDELPRLQTIWDLIIGTKIDHVSPCYEGMTDASGLLMLSAQEMSRCTKRNISNKVLNELYPPEAYPDDILYDQEKYGFAQPPRLLIVAEKGDDWTFMQTTQRGNPSIWQFGVTAAWEAERPLPRGTIFSDQFIYRPGDTVKIKGLSRYLLYGKLFKGKGSEYNLKLRDPQGGEKEIGKVKVSDFGTFHFDIPTEEGQRLGYYQVIAETPHRGLRFYGSFRLAEFRVPEFAVNLDVSKTITLPNETIDLSWEGNYYFGAPMAEAKSSLNITRRETWFRPPNWEKYSFWKRGYLSEKKVSISGRYLNESFDLDKQGKAGRSITLYPNDIPYPMTYQCDIEVEDVSRQTIGANKSITALPDHRLIGVKLSNWIVAKNDSFEASVVVSSPQGTALAGIPVTVKMIKRDYHTVRSKMPDGRFQVEHTAVTKEVNVQELVSADKPVEVSFIPEEAGHYIILAELRDKPKSGTAAATPLWVSGRDYVPWADTGEDKLEIIMDKEEYEIGEFATAFIKSPFPESELFLTVCRDKIFVQDTKRIQGSGFTYQFKVTEEMLPNAFVGAALYRIGDPIVPVEEEVGKHMQRIGFAPFKVSLASRYLDVAVNPDRHKYRPAEEVEVNIQVARSDKMGHRSELTVIVVDEAVLSLTGHRPPDLVKAVYQQRGLSARINDNRPFVITEAELLQKGVGYGGGLLGKLKDPQVRKNFLKLAYYNPNLVTDESGRAKFRFKLPDNLTTWRIMAVAVGENDLFGYGDDEIVVTQPFILRAVLPRLARLGDDFLSGVAVTNLTEADGQVDVRAEIDGNSISLEDKTNTVLSALIKPGESKTVLFPLLAEGVGETKLKFTAHFKGEFDGQSINEADALQTSLDVQDLLATETVVAVGETVDKHLQKIKIDDTVREDTGGLNITLSSTALTNIGEGAKYLVDYPYGCLEQTTSRLLALIQLKHLSEKYGFSLEAVKPVDEVIAANLRKVLLLQNSDGGFKFWPTSSRSSCYLSPYVAYLFSQSRTLGYEISDDVTATLFNYLDRVLRDPCYPITGWKAKAEFRINVLMGMHYLDRKDETYFEEYFNRRKDLSYGAQIHLAYLLFQSGKWQDEARTLLEEIKNGMFVTAQTAHFESPRELPPSWYFMYSPIITTADAAKLFLEMEPESPYIARFARYILNARKNGRWRYTYENAKAIDGLIQISLKKEATPPDYTANIVIAGNDFLKQEFKGYQYKPVENFIQMLHLPKGLNDIEIFKKGSGNLYYTLHYSYRLKGPQSARKQGFNITRTVRHRDTGRLVATYQDQPPQMVKINASDVLEVQLEYSVPQAGYHLVIDDPTPAGLEAIDTSLKTTAQRYRTQNRQRQVHRGTGGNPINHTEFRDDRVALFADNARAGIYQYNYLLRATTSGKFLWPAAKIFLMYEPEQFGSSAEGFIEIAAGDEVITLGK